jgi:hypothetical protein
MWTNQSLLPIIHVVEWNLKVKFGKSSYVEMLNNVVNKLGLKMELIIIQQEADLLFLVMCIFVVNGYECNLNIVHLMNACLVHSSLFQWLSSCLKEK